MSKRSRHPNKEIEAALNYAESLGWRVEKAKGKGHAWGRMYCRFANRRGCKMSVWSTPGVPEDHAERIVKKVNNCSCEGKANVSGRS